MARQQIKVGDKLLIPSTPATPATTSAASSSSQSPKKHRVETGETLYGISRSYGIDLADLLRANPGGNLLHRQGRHGARHPWC